MKLQSTGPSITSQAITQPTHTLTPAPGVQIKGPAQPSQVIHSLPKPIAKPFGAGKGFLTGGLSQIAPAKKQYQYEEQDSLEQDDASQIIQEEEDEGNYDEDSLTRKPKVESAQADAEVKVTIHNKQLLMDVLMGEGVGDK